MLRITPATRSQEARVRLRIVQGCRLHVQAGPACGSAAHMLASLARSPTMSFAVRSPATPLACSPRARRVTRRGACRPRASADKKRDQYGRTESQQRIAELDAAVTNAQKAAGEAVLNAMGPLADVLGLRPRGKARVASGQVSRWATARQELLAAQLKSVTAAKAQELMANGAAAAARWDRWGCNRTLRGMHMRCAVAPRLIRFGKHAGWKLVDVSPAEDYAEFHPAGAVSVPSVRFTGGSTSNMRDALRAVAFASLAVRPTEDVPAAEFGAAVAAAAAGAKGVILACAAGGTLRGTTNFPDGQASRSLMAARELLRLEDVSKGRLAVAHLQGGVSAWVAAGNAGEGTGEWSARKGRVPSVGGTKLTAARKLGVAARRNCA